MTTRYDLSWILPFLREALKVPSNFSFDQFADALWRVLENVQVPRVQQFEVGGLSGHTYDFEKAPDELRSATS
jgi:hypothetical protein